MSLSVNYSEPGVKDGSSPIGNYGWKGGTSVSRTFRVAWNDRITACRQLVGYSYPDGIGQFRLLRRELPEGTPWDRTLWCTSARIVRGEKWLGRTAYDTSTFFPLPGYPNAQPTKVEDGDSAGQPSDALFKANVYKWAIIQTEYTAADFTVLPDAFIDSIGGSEINRFVSQKEDRIVKGIMLPGGTMHFILGDGSTEVIPFSVPRIEFEKTVYATWHQVAFDAIPWQTIDSTIATVNKTEFLSYPPDTLLMLPPRVIRYVMANALIGCDVEFVYAYAPNLQTKLLYAKAGKSLGYKWVTTLSTNTVEPTPGAVPDNEYLFNEREFADCFLPSKP